MAARMLPRLLRAVAVEPRLADVTRARPYDRAALEHALHVIDRFVDQELGFHAEQLAVHVGVLHVGVLREDAARTSLAHTPLLAHAVHVARREARARDHVDAHRVRHKAAPCPRHGETRIGQPPPTRVRLLEENFLGVLERFRHTLSFPFNCRAIEPPQAPGLTVDFKDTRENCEQCASSNRLHHDGCRSQQRSPIRARGVRRLRSRLQDCRCHNAVPASSWRRTPLARIGRTGCAKLARRRTAL